MDPPAEPCGIPGHAPPAGARAAGPAVDARREKASGPPVGSLPRPARLASPAPSCPGAVAVATPPPSRPPPAVGRSVKSIVEWLEGPKRPDSSPAASIASGPARKATSAASVASAPPPVDQSIAIAPDVEDYSLTYLNYRGYYHDAPLARCLDGVHEDLSRKPLEQVFSDAEKNAVSGRTLVSVSSPVSSPAAAAEGETSAGADKDVRASTATAVSEEQTAGDGHAKALHLATPRSALAAAPVQGFIQRDLKEVEAF